MLALSCKDLLLVYVVICEVGGINNSSPSGLIKHAVSAPFVNANVSAAKVDLATQQAFMDFHILNWHISA